MDVFFTSGEGQGQFDFFCQGGCGWFKTNLNKKVGGEGKLFFFSVTSVWITFLSNGRVRQEGGVDPGQLKKFRQSGHLGGFNKYFFQGYFFYLTQ